MTDAAAVRIVAVKPASLPRCSEAEARIREALVRNARLDADTIDVETDGTEITLTGTVRSRAESNQACHAAWAIAGVTKVDNRLRVVRKGRGAARTPIVGTFGADLGDGQARR